MTRAVVVTMSDLEQDHPLPLIARRRVIGERMMISEVVLSPGFEVPVHHHGNEQIVVMLRGLAEFDLIEDGVLRTVVVRAGQTLVLPSNVPHGCRALEECVILDLFSPVSEKTGVDGV
ncbi:MAG: cupin domain-containing protein [Phycisphaeraceae bacterium]|nr:cupin domain-containing protein [Phycisphaeraceae bacterium]